MLISELIAKLQAVEKKHGDIGVHLAGDYYSEPIERGVSRLLYEEHPGYWRPNVEGAQSWDEAADKWVDAVPVLKLEIS
jgi:hypothetical protein